VDTNPDTAREGAFSARDLRVVVTGATGNVGTSVIEALTTDDRIADIVGLARRLPALERPKTTFRAVDITTASLVDHFAGADVVIHLAWLFQPSHHPLVTWRANVLGSERVFDAVAAAGVPALVYASSVGAYSRHFVPDRRVDETWPTHALPTAAYGREKAYNERMLDTFELRHPEVRVVRMRPAFIFRWSSGTEQRRLFLGPYVSRRLLQRGKLPLLPYPAAMRFQALHARDAADAYVRAATQDVRGPFNIAAEPVLDGPALGEILGARVVEVPRRAVKAAAVAAWRTHLVPVEPTLLDLAVDLPLMSTARAQRELGWRPQVSSAAALAEMFRGMAAGAGEATDPLAPDTPVRRAKEILSGVGSTAS
jgi:nucleoside-diphosphate-sugar epimerase